MSRSRSLRRYDWDEDGSEHCAEPALARRRRLDRKAKEGKKVLEVDRSGSLVHLERAAKRLKQANAHARVLSVPQWDMAKAVEAMKRAGVSGEVTNLCGSRLTRVKQGRPREEDDCEHNVSFAEDRIDELAEIDDAMVRANQPALEELAEYDERLLAAESEVAAASVIAPVAIPRAEPDQQSHANDRPEQKFELFRWLKSA